MAGFPQLLQQQQNFPANRFLTFHGPIQAPFTTQLRLQLSNLIHQKAQKVTLLFSSGGGATDDGMALYSYLRALPYELTIHAIGLVGSMGIPVFMGGKTRVASPDARFFFHDYTSNYVQQNGPISREIQKGNALILDDAIAWTKDVLKINTQLTDQDFDSLKMFDQPLLMDAKWASNVGIVSAIAEPAIPADSQPWVVA